VRIDFEIRHVVAHPFLRVLVPPDLTARGIPGLAIDVAGRAIVKHAAIGGPRPAPCRMDAHAGWIGGVAARGLIARFGKAARVNPNSTGGGAVVFEPRETGELLAG